MKLKELLRTATNYNNFKTFKIKKFAKYAKKAIIVMHGTSQDIMSLDENTTQFVKKALHKGYEVVDIGGPGSNERIINTQINNQGPGIYTMGNHLEDVGSLGLEMLSANIGGVARGTGVEENIEEAIEAFLAYKKLGYDSIDFVGFSRGAYTIPLVLDQLDQLNLVEGIDVSAALLDPVPGPLRKKLHKIPPWVKNLLLLYAQHEGRPGFTQAQYIVSPTTKVNSQVLVGVHGDVGGSTRSPVAKLALNMVESQFWDDELLSDEDQFALILEIMLNPQRYTRTSLEHSLSPRSTRMITGVGYYNDVDIMAPYAQAYEVLWKKSSLFRRLVTQGSNPYTSINTKEDKLFQQVLENSIQAIRQRSYSNERLQDYMPVNFSLLARNGNKIRHLQQQVQKETESIRVIKPQYGFRDNTSGLIISPPPVYGSSNPDLLKQLLYEKIDKRLW